MNTEASKKNRTSLSYIEINCLSHLLLQQRSTSCEYRDKDWRESYYFNATDEKQQLSLITTIGILPNRRRCSGFVIILHKGRIAVAELLLTKEIGWHETHNFRLRDLSYRVEGIDWHLRYSSKKCSFDMLFRPVNEFYSYNKETDEKRAKNFEGLFSQHIEQAGVFKGNITVNGEQMNFGPSPGHRDHSWGIRDWSSIDNYWLFSCTFSKKRALNLWKRSSKGNEFGAGYIYQSGRNLEIISSEIIGQYTNDQGEPNRCEISFTDEKGGKHKLRCEVLCSVPIPMTRCIIYETIARMEYDNMVGFGLLERLVHDSNPLHKVKALIDFRKRSGRRRR